MIPRQELVRELSIKHYGPDGSEFTLNYPINLSHTDEHKLETLFGENNRNILSSLIKQARVEDSSKEKAYSCAIIILEAAYTLHLLRFSPNYPPTNHVCFKNFYYDLASYCGIPSKYYHTVFHILEDLDNKVFFE